MENLQHHNLQQPSTHPGPSPWDVLDDPATRRQLAKRLGGFCLIYLSHYLQLPPGEFHPQMIKSIEDHDLRFLELLGFRGSTKSTFASLALPLWTALEYPDLYPFIVPIADTGQQAALNIAAIKYELEYNRLLLQDYGKLEIGRASDKSPNLREDGDPLDDLTLESEEEWQAKNMLLSNGVRILARSRGQKIRGLRHRQHRVKLAIADDVEDTKWIKNRENRNTTERWWRGEVLPGVDEQTGRVVLIGNWLHEDALMARMEKSGIFKTIRIPLIKAGDGPEIDRCTWKGKYPTQEALDKQKQIVGPVAWAREYLLISVPEEGQEVIPDDITYYDELPEQAKVSLVGTGIDYAISKKQTADCTAMVSGSLSYEEESGRPHIDIHPHPVNDRLDMPETISHAKAINAVSGLNHIIFGEEVGYQKAANDEMERQGLPIERVKVTADKRARLRVAAIYIKNGIVRFPRTGCETLLQQLFGFGVEDHDDLVDALVHLILGLVGQGLDKKEIIDLMSLQDDD